jgi:hypothetical protein
MIKILEEKSLLFKQNLMDDIYKIKCLLVMNYLKSYNLLYKIIDDNYIK